MPYPTIQQVLSAPLLWNYLMILLPRRTLSPSPLPPHPPPPPPPPPPPTPPPPPSRLLPCWYPCLWAPVPFIRHRWRCTWWRACCLVQPPGYHMGPSKASHCQRPWYAWTTYHYRVWFSWPSVFLTISASTGILSVSWWPLHLWWGHTLQRTDHHTPSLYQEVLLALHAAHQGVNSMLARAESSVFWPGITPASTEIRARCDHCNRIAPSQPSAPPVPPISPAYPFHADFFHNGRVYYLVVVDRYSNWPIVEVATSGTHGLISCLRLVFVTYGISNELTSDGGPEFTATVTCQFLKDWGVSHRLSSVTFPHSNCRAEVGMKTVKRILMNNTGPRGSLDTDAFQWAMLQYRNTPDCETKLSPAECVFGSPIRDLIPIHPGRYTPTIPGRKHWKHARKPWGTDTCRMLNDGLNTLVAYVILLLVIMSVYRIKLAPILENGTKLGVS